MATKSKDMFKDDWVGRLKRKVHEALKGDAAYLSEKQARDIKVRKWKAKEKAQRKPYGHETATKTMEDTARTKSVSDSLSSAGLTKEEIAKLRGKKGK